MENKYVRVKKNMTWVKIKDTNLTKTEGKR